MRKDTKETVWQKIKRLFKLSNGAYRVANKDKDMVIAQRASVARGFFGRLLGLMFKPSLDQTAGLIFYNSGCIHTCFMRFPIDIIFADKNMRVIKVCEAVRPWRAVSCPKAFFTLELNRDKARQTKLETGDILELTPVKP